MSAAVIAPRSLADALAHLHANPSLEPLAGGTDLMVEVNHGGRRPETILALDRVPELQGWRRDGDRLVVGAGCTYTEMLATDFAGLAPALAQAARTVGSPQIRNAGTLGGNIATASPAGDTLPVLMALDATIVIAGVAGERSATLDEVITGVKRTSIAPDELIVAVSVPVAAGPQEYLKIGTRNAMVISVAGFALALDTTAQTVGASVGSVTATPVRANEAEEFAVNHIDWSNPTDTDPGVPARFGELVATVARPIDDHRSTAEYRRHGIEVMARRAMERCLR